MFSAAAIFWPPSCGPRTSTAAPGRKRRWRASSLQIRARWPRVKIVLRADSGFARDGLMAWCEANAVDYVFGLARDQRLEARIADAAERGLALFRRPMRASRRGCLATSNGRRRTAGRAGSRVIGKAEWTQGEANPRFLVTSLKADVWRAQPHTRNSIARAARWRTGSRNARVISSPTEPRPRRCAPIGCGRGSPRSPMRSCARCAASPRRTPRSRARPAARSA